MNRKFLIAISVVFSIVVGLWIWTLASPKNVINIGGSASVDPIMQRTTNKYKDKTNKSFVYSSTGSTSGINNLKSHVYQIGFISKEVPDNALDKEIKPVDKSIFATGEEQFKNYFQEEENRNIYHSVNFANDAIVFIYNIKGTGFGPFADYLSFNVENGKIQDSTLLKKIYEVQSQDKIVKWSWIAEWLIENNEEMLKDHPIEYWTEKLKKVKNIDVTPYASTPGSGTLTSFENLTGVKAGQAVNRYGNNGSIFAQIAASNGAFGFVNLAFAQEIAKPRFNYLRTAIITDSQNNKWNIGKNEYPPNKEPYPLARPFIALFYNDFENQKMMKTILEFVYWFATDPSLASDYAEEGLNQLMASTQIKEMKIKNLWIKWKKVEEWLWQN